MTFEFRAASAVWTEGWRGFQADLLPLSDARVSLAPPLLPRASQFGLPVSPCRVRVGWLGW